MNPNQKPFDLALAQQGHNLCTRDNRPAKFIAYVPDVISHHQVLVKINDEVVRYEATGRNPHGNTHWDLFLSPLGICQGLPVFAGDKLITKTSGKDYIVEVDDKGFENFKWPSKPPVVETRMTEKECYNTYHKGNDYEQPFKVVANKAISRAIADGDVIPTKEITKLVNKAVNKWARSSDHDVRNPNDWFDVVLNDYLEGLK